MYEILCQFSFPLTFCENKLFSSIFLKIIFQMFITINVILCPSWFWPAFYFRAHITGLWKLFVHLRLLNIFLISFVFPKVLHFFLSSLSMFLLLFLSKISVQRLFHSIIIHIFKFASCWFMILKILNSLFLLN